jgi:hypothetical protein
MTLDELLIDNPQLKKWLEELALQPIKKKYKTTKTSH